MKQLSPHTRAVALVLLAFFAYNVADAFLNKVVDLYHFGSVGFYPLISYLILFLLFSKKLGGLGHITKTTKLKLHIARGILGAIGFIGFIFAITYISLAETYTLVLTSPFWVALISIILFKHKIGIHRWIAMVGGFIGVLIVLQPGSNAIHMAALGALACAVSVAIIMIIVKKIGAEEPMVNHIFFPVAVITIVMALINTFWKGWEPIALEDFIFFGLSGAIFLIADLLFSRGFSEEADTDFLAPLHYSQIIWGALIGYFFFNETPEKWTFIGASIIIVSGVYLIHREAKQNK